MLENNRHNKELVYFFRFLAIYSLVSGALHILTRNYIFSEQFQTGDLLRDVYINTVIECVLKIVTFLPPLLVAALFIKKVKKTGRNLSAWFEIYIFIVVSCGILFSIATMAVCSNHEAADIFSALIPSFFLLIVSINTCTRKIGWIAYAYVLLPMSALSIMGLIFIYTQYVDSTRNIVGFVQMFSYVKSFFYVVYPSLGYMSLAIFLKKVHW